MRVSLYGVQTYAGLQVRARSVYGFSSRTFSSLICTSVPILSHLARACLSNLVKAVFMSLLTRCRLVCTGEARARRVPISISGGGRCYCAATVRHSPGPTHVKLVRRPRGGGCLLSSFELFVELCLLLVALVHEGQLEGFLV